MLIQDFKSCISAASKLKKLTDRFRHFYDTDLLLHTGVTRFNTVKRNLKGAVIRQARDVRIAHNLLFNMLFSLSKLFNEPDRM